MCPSTARAKVAPALLGGQVEAAIVPSGGVSGSISKMKVLAVFAPERSKRFPDAPTMKEVGYDINSAVGRYIAAPEGVPAEKRKVLEDAFKTILSNPEVIARYENAGTRGCHGSPAKNCARCLKSTKGRPRPWSSSIRRRRASSPPDGAALGRFRIHLLS